MKRKTEGSKRRWPRQNFYFSYTGNKWRDLQHIVPRVDEIMQKKDIKYIVEPFCGSAAFSYFFWCVQHQPKSVFMDGFFPDTPSVKTLATQKAHIKYHINDSDNIFVGFLRYVPRNKSLLYDELQRESYRNIGKADYERLVKPYVGKREAPLPSQNPVQIYSEFLLSRAFTFHTYGRYNSTPGAYPRFTCLRTTIGYDCFLTDDDNVHISCIDFRQVLDSYQNKPEALVFLDPPYYSSESSRSTYVECPGKKKCKKMLEQIRDFLESCVCSVIMTLDDSVFTRDLFDKYIAGTYAKTYSKSNAHSSVLLIIK